MHSLRHGYGSEMSLVARVDDKCWDGQQVHTHLFRTMRPSSTVVPVLFQGAECGAGGLLLSIGMPFASWEQGIPWSSHLLKQDADITQWHSGFGAQLYNLRLVLLQSFLQNPDHCHAISSMCWHHCLMILAHCGALPHSQKVPLP